MALSLSPQACVEALEKKLQISFSKPELALCAITHKSYTNEHKTESAAHNERLEFLGDAVVDLAVSHQLMHRFPQAEEGELSRLRAQMVNEEGLAKAARRLALGEVLLLGRGEELTGGRTKASVLADALEAVIGAVYLSEGFAAVQTWVDREFAEAFESLSSGDASTDFKTRLQELIQTQQKISPRYRVVGEHGPEHEKVFDIEVFAGGESLGRATGRNKKEGEQAAARVALERLKAFDPGQSGE